MNRKRRVLQVLGAVCALQSDFLDFYVSYLRELPECLSVVSMLGSNPMNTASLLEVNTKALHELASLRLFDEKKKEYR